jgi:hypothetical protein
MKEVKKINLLYLSIIICLITYNFWKLILEHFDFQIFYIGMALSQFILSVYIKLISKTSFASFFLFCIMTNNLLDEIFFNPEKIEINEYIATSAIVAIYFLKFKNTLKK